MSAEQYDDYNNTCTELNTRIVDLTVRMNLSKQNRATLAQYKTSMETCVNNINTCNNLIQHLKPILSDIQEYVVARRKESMQNINNALRLSGQIIQDATEGIYVQMEGDEAWLSTPDGMEVQMVEGGGYRQISSTFLRSVMLGCNCGALQTMLLDEIFSLVSPDNSSVLSLYLSVMCENMQIISIEQKPQVYSNVDGVMYTFTKGEQYAVVTKKILERGIVNGVN